jgi:hypothetical protein
MYQRLSQRRGVLHLGVYLIVIFVEVKLKAKRYYLHRLAVKEAEFETQNVSKPF